MITIPTYKLQVHNTLRGPQGETGAGLAILGTYESEELLRSERPTGSAGDAWMIGENLYVWSIRTSDWTNVGGVRGPQGESAMGLVKMEVDVDGNLYAHYIEYGENPMFEYDDITGDIYVNV